MKRKIINLILLVTVFALCCVNNTEAVVLFQDDFESNTTVSAVAWPDGSGDCDPDNSAVGSWAISEDWDEGVQVSSFTGGTQPASAHSEDNYLIAGYHGEYDNTFQHSGLATAEFISSVDQAVVDFWVWGFSGQYGIVHGRDLNGNNERAFELLFWDGFEIKYDGIELAARLTNNAWNHIVVDLDLVNDTAGVTINNEPTEFFTAGNLTDNIDTLLFRDEYTGYYDDITVSISEPTVEPALVSYYPFDGTLEDTVGPYDGTIMPSGVPNYIAGPYSLGQALLLDGSKYVDIGYGQPKGEVMRNGSVSLWFNMSADPVRYNMFFGTMNDGFSEGIWSGVTTSNLLDFEIRNGQGANVTWDNNREDISFGTWYFYTATWGVNSQTGNLNINEYVNGVLIRSGTQVDLGSVFWQYPMVLGAANSRGSVEDFFIGAIDDIKFYNYPLSVAEIQQEYVDVTGNSICADPPVADVTGDCLVNLNDLAMLAAEWLLDNNINTSDLPLLPLDAGEIDIIKEDVKLFSDRNSYATIWPSPIRDQIFVRASYDSCSVKVQQEGYLMVVTPTYGQYGGFSEEAILRAAGFDRVDIEPFLPFKGASSDGDTSCVYQKLMYPEDIYVRENQYGITLWREDPLPLYEIPLPQTPPVNMNPGPEYADDVRVYQSTPAIECAGNGRLWASWYGGGTGEGYLNYIMLATSGDDGNTWSDLKLVIDPDGGGPLRASEPGLWLDPSGRLWLIWNQYLLGLAGPESETWAIVTNNPDSENPTWSAPQLVGYPNMNCICRPIALSDGTWLWPGSSFYYPVYSKPLLSNDQGASFTPGGELVILPEEDRDWQEYSVTELNDGRLWATVRTQYGIGESFSNDKGLTWSQIAPSSIIHVPARHVMIRLSSGKLLLIKHGEIDEKVGQRERLMAMVSDDEGQTWSDGFMLDERTGAAAPYGTQGPDGTIYIIYDRNRTTDKEILMATFTEEDVIQGQNVSGKVRLQVIVNKATGTQ